jgi:hypothetical protein
MFRFPSILLLTDVIARGRKFELKQAMRYHARFHFASYMLSRLCVVSLLFLVPLTARAEGPSETIFPFFLFGLRDKSRTGCVLLYLSRGQVARYPLRNEELEIHYMT